MARLWAFAALAGLIWAGTAAAGDVYVCKGPNGVNSYQNTPCAPGKELKHQTFSDSLGRPPAPPAYREIPPPPPLPENPGRGIGVAGLDVEREAPAGYECTAGRRTWVQTAPCPATYTTGAPITVNGVNQFGQPIHGTGTVAQQAPVQQQELDHDTLCSKVQDGANMGHGWTAGRQSYERTKLRGQLGC